MSLSGEGVPLVIVAYEDIYQWVAEQEDGLGDTYQKQAAVVRLCSSDIEDMGLRDSGRVELRSESGSIVVEAKPDAVCREGTGFVPVSLYSNRLADYHLSPSGLPRVKHIQVRAVPTDKEVTPLSDLLVRKTVA